MPYLNGVGFTGFESHTASALALLSAAKTNRRLEKFQPASLVESGLPITLANRHPADHPEGRCYYRVCALHPVTNRFVFHPTANQFVPLVYQSGLPIHPSNRRTA